MRNIHCFNYFNRSSVPLIISNFLQLIIVIMLSWLATAKNLFTPRLCLQLCRQKRTSTADSVPFRIHFIRKMFHSGRLPPVRVSSVLHRSRFYNYMVLQCQMAEHVMSGYHGQLTRVDKVSLNHTQVGLHTSHISVPFWQTLFYV